jgi:isocitrate/isopropylmalate dehydrogenase
MPADGLEQLKKFDAIYFGAVGWPGTHTPSISHAFSENLVNKFA